MVCDTIKSLRETAGLSQSALAKRLGVTRSSVNAWEMGLSIPTAQYIVELSQLFHVSTDYLLGLNNTQAIYIDRLSQEEKQILYSLIHYFQDKQ
ncbi:MAG: helix-turn-helix transcriptional regulator [Bacillota bacterium]|jgi:transcriptional regulator with XRE-family HTH domain|nr:helix-turn-helix transcriptional regulator [Bacillota bacterium]